MQQKSVIVILGQTATGKSALAVKIAKQVNGEIISADSRQVYKGLDIGTGKITTKEMKEVPHHLLDIANPKIKFTVAEYQKLAIRAMADIASRRKIPIICGGTGFYIDSITKGIVFPEVPPNNKLRKRLLTLSTAILFVKLKNLDKARAKNIEEKNEQNNKVRLIRAIEIAKALGKVPKLKYTTNSAMAEFVVGLKFLKIGLHLPKEKLKRKIEQRLLSRLKRGMVKEAEKLYRGGLSWRRMKELGLEYKFMALYLQNKVSRKEMVQKLNSEIYKYAKRQMTWFKRDKEIKWFDMSEKNLEKIISTISAGFTTL